jgi:hypothetical protein
MGRLPDWSFTDPPYFNEGVVINAAPLVGARESGFTSTVALRHRESIARFGSGLKAIHAIARTLA